MVASVLTFSSHARSEVEVIQLPDEELENETVLPKFDNKAVVLNRAVTLKGKIEIGGGVGFNLTEALYNNLNVNVNLTYNFSELHALNLSGFMIFDGLSNTGRDLKSGKGLVAGDSFDASRAPHPEKIYLLNYQINAYYGKISLTKNTVMNLHLFGTVGAGMIDFGDATKPGINFGFGQKIYLTENSGLRLDFRFIFFQGPEPTSRDLKTGQGGKLASSAFEQKLLSHTQLTAGYVFLF